MECKIKELGDMDAWWPERERFEGLMGEMIEDDYFEYDEKTGWAKGYFDCEDEIGVTFPVYFSEVRIKEL